MKTTRWEEETRGPFSHRRYRLSGAGLKEPSLPGRRDVWSYRTKTREEFHCDVFDGERFISHLTFTVRREKR